MSDPYIGEIRIFAGNFAPAGWAFCDGQLLAISENDALFQLIGTTYGGDGEETFALPNLQSRTPMHHGNGLALAEMAGVESVSLTVQQLPTHTHPLAASAAGATALEPGGNVTAEAAKRFYSSPPATTTPMSPSAIAPVGGSQPHENMAPYLGLNFILSLFGRFPSTT